MYDSLYTNNFKKGPFPNIIIKVRNREEAKNIIRKKKKYEKRCEGVGESLNAFKYTKNLPSRKFLGSSQKPLITSKKRLREVVQSGLSKEEIETQYRIGPSIKRSLGAFLAHRTMETYQSVEPKPKPKKTLPKIEKPKAKPKNNLPRLIPRKYEKQLFNENKISKNMQLRMNDFLKETKHLADKRKQDLYHSVSESNWFKDLNKNPSDLEVYTFFDDIMLNFVYQNKHIKANKITSLWDKIKSSNKLYETIPLLENKLIKQLETKSEPKPNTKPKKQKLTENKNQEIYDYIKAGFPDNEIMETCNISKQQLGARKAWITMRNK